MNLDEIGFIITETDFFFLQIDLCLILSSSTCFWKHMVRCQKISLKSLTAIPDLNPVDSNSLIKTRIS